MIFKCFKMLGDVRMNQKSKYLPILMWLIPLSFFGYQFVLRLWPSLMMNQIMHQFMIDATGFGILASVYYYGYSGFQIPIAILLDKFGARYIIFACAVICGLATFAFSFSDNWYVALFSRFAIGVGSAAGFLGVSKVISQWFSKDSYSKMVGFSFTIGLMGALYGGRPISVLVETHSWQNVALTLSCVSIAIGLCAFFILRSPKEAAGQTEDHPFRFSELKVLLKSPTIWYLGIANFLLVGILEGFTDVWGIPYLMTAYSIAKPEAAELVSFVFIGMLFGGPILALLSRKIGTYSVICLCGVGITVIFFNLLYLSSFNWYLLAGLFFIIGIFCCYQVIMFAAGSDLVRPQLLGVTIAFLNSMNMIGGSFFHSTIGVLMDYFWTGVTNEEGIRQYSLDSFDAALSVIPVAAVVGSCLVMWVAMKQRKSKRLVTQN